MEILSLELRKLGLKEKEVEVYLAGLELGPSTILKIAQKVKITRPTVYEIIKTLEKKGLFVEKIQKRKRYFVAQSPDSLLGILRTQKRELEEKEREFIRIIAALRAKYYKKEESGIRVFKGKEGLKVLEEELLTTPSQDIYLLSSITRPKEIKERELIYQKIQKRFGKIQVKEIYCGPKQKQPPTKIFGGGQRKSLSSLYFDGTLILFDKAIFIPSKKTEGILIDNPIIVNLLKSLFLSLWNIKGNK